MAEASRGTPDSPAARSGGVLAGVEPWMVSNVAVGRRPRRS
jgi:hypothetical protein